MQYAAWNHHVYDLETLSSPRIDQCSNVYLLDEMYGVGLFGTEVHHS